MEVLNHPFFSTIDFHALYRKEIIPSYVPVVTVDKKHTRNSIDASEENNDFRMTSSDFIFNENRYPGNIYIYL
jgi:hypothetical protein